MDELDFSNRYNTKLTPQEEVLFREYVAKHPDKINPNDAYDYDVKGAWKALIAGDIEHDERGHLTDQFKKPNHPTFSGESMYDGVDGHVGGSWYNDGKGMSAYFAPLSHLYNMEDLADYFNRVERDTNLIDLRLMFGHLYGN